ncbi:MAG: hypothetical protein JNK58_03500 [Phycisphaerae bacterium]|nr:hypothetical protein [Phycisphaerae bacterium]
MKLSTISGLCSVAAVSAASGQVVSLSFDAPTIDRWVYPFASSAGYEFEAKTFSSLGQETAFFPITFDQRDGQIMVGFDFPANLPPGRGACGYRVISAVLTLKVSNHNVYKYDPTYDGWQTYLNGAGDADGRPIELYGAAFRNGWMACRIDPSMPALNQFPCYWEGSPERAAPPFGPGSFPTRDTRYAYATDYAGRVERDVSNNVRDQFDSKPFAVGQIGGLAPGALVPVDRDTVFTLNVNDADVQAYLRRACDAGLVRLLVTSLQQASAGGPGPGGGSFASFYTKEIGIDGFGPRFSISVRLTSAGDADGSGGVDFADITSVLTNWGLVGPDGDANCDGVVNFSDITEVLTNWGSL